LAKARKPALPVSGTTRSRGMRTEL
jgi:hypothetical protein